MASNEKEELTLLHLDFVCTVFMGNSYFFKWTMEALAHGFSRLLLNGALGFWTCSCDCRGLCLHWILCLLIFELFLWISSENMTLVHTAIWIRSSSIVLLLIAFFIRCHWINYILRNSVELLFFMLLGFSCTLSLPFPSLFRQSRCPAVQPLLCFGAAHGVSAALEKHAWHWALLLQARWVEFKKLFLFGCRLTLFFRLVVAVIHTNSSWAPSAVPHHWGCWELRCLGCAPLAVLLQAPPVSHKPVTATGFPVNFAALMRLKQYSCAQRKNVIWMFSVSPSDRELISIFSSCQRSRWFSPEECLHPLAEWARSNRGWLWLRAIPETNAASSRQTNNWQLKAFEFS